MSENLSSPEKGEEESPSLLFEICRDTIDPEDYELLETLDDFETALGYAYASLIEAFRKSFPNHDEQSIEKYEKFLEQMVDDFLREKGLLE